MFMFCISRQVTPKFNVAVGAVYTGRSSYDSLQINVEGLPPSVVKKDWKNVWRYQLEFE
jgi:long-subunit fatty acid transport protein